MVTGDTTPGARLGRAPAAVARLGGGAAGLPDRWTRRGLEGNEKVVYTETPNLPLARSFPGVLEDRGADVAAATAEGSAALTFVPERAYATFETAMDVLCRTLAVATRRFRERDGQVLLVAPQPALLQTLRLLDLDQLPGLQVVGGDA